MTIRSAYDNTTNRIHYSTDAIRIEWPHHYNNNLSYMAFIKKILSKYYKAFMVDKEDKESIIYGLFI